MKHSRTSHRRCSVKKVFLKILQILQENTCAGVSFDKKFIKKRISHRFFPVKFTIFLRTAIVKNICQRLLLTLRIKGLIKTFKRSPWQELFSEREKIFGRVFLIFLIFSFSSFSSSNWSLNILFFIAVFAYST